MIVCKFGGSSISNVKNIEQIKEILFFKLKEEHKKILAVFSASGKTTNKLILIGQKASQQLLDYNTILQEVIDYHQQLSQDLKIISEPNFQEQLNNIFQTIQDTVLGIYYLQEMTPKTQDYLMSQGEKLSALIMFTYLNKDLIIKDNNLQIKFYDSTEYLITDNHYGQAKINFNITQKNISTIQNDNFNLAICSGFIAQNYSGQITTIGRGGGDYSAAIYGANLSALRVEIWTDVNGIMTSNPKNIPEALSIEYLSYQEMMELSHFGANVIYTPTIIPLFKQRIPIVVKNTLCPTNPGTEIGYESRASKYLATAITSLDKIVLIKISGDYLIGRIGFSQNLFNVLSSSNINIIMISQSSCEYSMYLVINHQDLHIAKSQLNEIYQSSIENEEMKIEFLQEKSLLAIETNNPLNITPLMLIIYNILNQQQTTIYTQNTSDHNICFIIDKDKLLNIHQLIHQKIFS